MANSDVLGAINRADGETARELARGRCRSCGVAVSEIVSELRPQRGRWLDGEGNDHGACPNGIEPVGDAARYAAGAAEALWRACRE